MRRAIPGRSSRCGETADLGPERGSDEAAVLRGTLVALTRSAGEPRDSECRRTPPARGMFGVVGGEDERLARRADCPSSRFDRWFERVGRRGKPATRGGWRRGNLNGAGRQRQPAHARIINGSSRTQAEPKSPRDGRKSTGTRPMRQIEGWRAPAGGWTADDAGTRTCERNGSRGASHTRGCGERSRPGISGLYRTGLGLASHEPHAELTLSAPRGCRACPRLAPRDRAASFAATECRRICNSRKVQRNAKKSLPLSGCPPYTSAEG